MIGGGGEEVIYDEDGIDGPFERGMAKPIKMIHHLCVDIRGYLLNHRERDMADMFKHDDGRPMSGHEAKEQLLEELAKGRRVLPVGECEGFDYQTGCPGHVAND